MPTTTTVAPTYREALAQPHTALRGHEGFTYVQYAPSVGLTARPKVITVLFCEGVEVDRGSLASLRAMLKHQPTEASLRAYAATKKEN